MLKIKNVSYERLEFNLSEPYTIAYETVSKSVNFILKIETDTLHVGYGCAAPDKVVTGETPGDVEKAIVSIIIPFLKEKNAYMTANILEEFKKLLPYRTSALAMVDMALSDLMSRKFETPLYKYLGGYRHSIPTSITIGISSIEDTLKIAEEYIKQGFFILKVKGGLIVEEDIEKLTRLRENFKDIQLRFDGNQGYTVKEAIAFFEATKHLNIEIFEQPTKEGEDTMLGQVTNKIDIPVMADESIKTLKDTFRLAQNGIIDMVNIKLMKVGGIREAIYINSVAKSAGLEAMIGCIDECGLGISAGLHFALSTKNIQYADLDGHLDLMEDPFKGLFTLHKGVLYPTNSFGLGSIRL